MDFWNTKKAIFYVIFESLYFYFWTVIKNVILGLLDVFKNLSKYLKFYN